MGLPLAGHLGQLAEYWPRRHGFDSYLGTLSTHDHGMMTNPDVRRHGIAGIWVAFFSRCQRYRCRQGSTTPYPCTVLVRDDNITHRLTNGHLATAANPSPPGWPAGYPPDGGGPDPTRATRECASEDVLSGGDHAVPFGVDGLIPLYTEEITSFVRKSVAAKQPFLLVYTPDNTHVPIYASPKFLGKSQRGIYGDAVEELDDSVGQLLSAIDSAGAKDDTFVVFSSDK